METLGEKSRSFFDISNIDYEYVKDSEEFKRDPVLQSFLKEPYLESLENKTQVTQRFLCEKNVSTRLSHTFQVIRLSKEIAEIRGNDVQTVVRIAAFHDCGHVPFGHIGEKYMKEILRNINSRPTVLGDMIGCEERKKAKKYNDFNHEMMSGIIFEKVVKDHNLEVPEYEKILEGVLNHGSGMLNSKSIEGKIVGIADKVSYIIQDLKDAHEIGFSLDFPKTLGKTPGAVLEKIMDDIKGNIGEERILSENVVKDLEDLKEFMYRNFYTSEDLKILDRMVGSVLQFVFVNWCSEFYELREDLSDNCVDLNYYKDFFKEEDLKKMLDFDEMFLKFISLSDEEILDRTEINEREFLKSRTDNYKKLGILEKYGF